jgi:pimeloyl-ACP methyl ester carboxylesterase
MKRGFSARERGGSLRRLGRAAALLAVLGVMMLASGCVTVAGGAHSRGQELGKIWFVSGAGPIGNVTGSQSVPAGLRRAGWQGAIERFQWQSMLGGTIRDQMDRGRNEGQGRRLAEEMVAYQAAFPGRPMHLIAFSAGTGVATWALEALPDVDPQGRVRVGHVVFLGSSLSREYDLTPALRRIDGHLYSFYSKKDPILRYMLPLAGSVDGQLWQPRPAGRYGFALPGRADHEMLDLYRRKLRNRRYRDVYERFGYGGGHTDSVNARFIRHVVAELLRRPLDPATPTAADAPGDAADQAPADRDASRV